MLHSARYLGAQYLLGLFSQHTRAIQVIDNSIPKLITILTLIFFFPIVAFISDMLSCRLFLITTRLAYAVYLTQFPIFFYNVGTTRHSGYYHFITSTVNVEYFIGIISFLYLSVFFLLFSGQFL